MAIQRGLFGNGGMNTYMIYIIYFGWQMGMHLNEVWALATNPPNWHDMHLGQGNGLMG